MNDDQYPDCGDPAESLKPSRPTTFGPPAARRTN